MVKKLVKKLIVSFKYLSFKRILIEHNSHLFRSGSESEDDSSGESEPPKREYKGRLAEMTGRIVLMEIEDRKKALMVPVLVCDPNASDLDLKTKDHLLVKSFKDSKL